MALHVASCRTLGGTEEDSKMRILVVEDEPALRHTIGKRIVQCGYAVDCLSDGEEAWNYLTSTEYDCVVLDIMLPKVDGYEVLERMRSRQINVPVLFLTAKDTIEDRVTGLDRGADDYLVKPFSFDELHARIRALLRRASVSRESRLTADDLAMDVALRSVRRGNTEIELTAKEFAVLEYFLRNKGRLLTRSQIIDHVWNYNFDYESNVVDVYVRYLRRKIDDGFDKKLIRTVRGAGYVVKE